MRDTAGSAAAPAARCKNLRRGSFIFEPPHIIRSPLRCGRAASAAPRCRAALRPSGLMVRPSDISAEPFRHYSAWMPASLIILPHLPSWTLTKLSSPVGELEHASKPTLPTFDLTSP